MDTLSETDELAGISSLSTDEETLGFDISAGERWIYPENFPIRDYQFNIVQTALYHNTLVCLPTGLGKTFIAAVIMYNFWRWYPHGKVLFLAPTKPLVAQQINACREVIGIPADDCIELTGSKSQAKRVEEWKRKRVIFATPQVIQKDLEAQILPAKLVKCIVIDEAHKALGNHAYAESIRLLSNENKHFRVLGLSATPGSKPEQVIQVITNLQISRLELRDDSSIDIMRYVNKRNMEIVRVPLGDTVNEYRTRYQNIIEPHIRVLYDNKVINSIGQINKDRIYHMKNNWNQRPNRDGNWGFVFFTMNVLYTMYHADELLVRNGLRAFLHFYENNSDKPWLRNELALSELLADVKTHLGTFPNAQSLLEDGLDAQIPQNIVFGHEKFSKLREVLTRHFNKFQNSGETTRAIVFVEYRDIVNEVFVLLLQLRPLIRPQMLMGQAGQKQKQQNRAVSAFRSNEVNVLISTSVGEEGLDVGEVDLIVCFDISQKSPIRLVQRMGRTGRKREGNVVVLVTDGKEHATLMNAITKKNTMNQKILSSRPIKDSILKESPRMIPRSLNPQCHKMLVTVKGFTPKAPAKGRKKNEAKIRKPITASKSIKDYLFDCNDPQPSTSSAAHDATAASTSNANESPAKTAQAPKNFINALQTRINNSINSKNVKLLTVDELTIEFLTLCAMKRSEERRSELEDIDSTFLVEHSDPDIDEGYFDFTPPDFENLKQIKYLSDEPRATNDYSNSQSWHQAPLTNNYCDPGPHENDMSVDYGPLVGVEVSKADLGEFESLLDDSSNEEAFQEALDQIENKDCKNKTDDSVRDLVGRESNNWSDDFTYKSNNKENSHMEVDEVKHNGEMVEDIPDNWSDFGGKHNGEMVVEDIPDNWSDFEGKDEEPNSWEQMEKAAAEIESKEAKKNEPGKLVVYEFDSLLETSSDESNQDCDVTRKSADNTLVPDNVGGENSNCNLSSVTIVSNNNSDSRRNFDSSTATEKQRDSNFGIENKPAASETSYNASNCMETPKKATSDAPVSKTLFDSDKENNSIVNGTDQSKKASSTSYVDDEIIIIDSDSDDEFNNNIHDLTGVIQEVSSPDVSIVETNSRDSIKFQDTPRKPEDTIEDVNDDVWISAKKTCNNENPTSESLSKKLSQVKDRAKAKLNFDDDFDCFDFEQIEKLESSYFSAQPSKESNATTSSTASNGKPSSQSSNLQKSTEFGKDVAASKSSSSGSQRDNVWTSKPNKFASSKSKESTGSRSSTDLSQPIHSSPVKGTEPSGSVNTAQLGNFFSSKAKQSTATNNKTSTSSSSTGSNYFAKFTGVKSKPSEDLANKRNLLSMPTTSLKANIALSGFKKKKPVIEDVHFPSDDDDDQWQKPDKRGKCSSSSSSANAQVPSKPIVNDHSRPTLRDSTSPILSSQRRSSQSLSQSSSSSQSRARSPLFSEQSKDPKPTTSSLEFNKVKPAIALAKPSTIITSSSKQQTNGTSEGTTSKWNKWIGNSSSSNELSKSSSTAKPQSTAPPKFNFMESFKKPLSVQNSRTIDNSSLKDDINLFRKPQKLHELKNTLMNKMNDSRANVDNNKASAFKKPLLPQTTEKRPLNGSRSSMDIVDLDDCSEWVSSKKSEGTSKERKQTAAVQRTTISNPKRKKRRKAKNGFFDDEAEVTDDESGNSDEMDDDGEDDGEDLESFVSYTQDVTNHADMTAVYLQAAKSPINPKGRFFIKRSSVEITDTDIFSQMPQQDDTYVNDSFCVKDVSDGEASHDDNELERLEEILKSRSKRKRTKSSERRVNKRLKYHQEDGNNSSSSEDELEKMRKQVQEQSFLSKRS